MSSDKFFSIVLGYWEINNNAEMIDEIRGILQRWQRPAEIRLRAGEMTTGRYEQLRAVLGGLASEIDMFVRASKKYE
jgi:hypothetical protein